MRHVCLFILIAGLCHGVSKAAECTARGKFPNDDVADCRGFTICLLGGASAFTQYKLTCPVGFVYSHLEQQCTNATNYKCMSSFVCNLTGSFENLSSTNCSSYIACPNSLNGIVTARQVECPLDQVFSPAEAVCVNNTQYKCSASVEKKDVTDSFTELPSERVSHNTTDFNIQVSGENEFHVSSVVSNGVVDVATTRACLFVALMLVLIKF